VQALEATVEPRRQALRVVKRSQALPTRAATDIAALAVVVARAPVAVAAVAALRAVAVVGAGFLVVAVAVLLLLVAAAAAREGSLVAWVVIKPAAASYLVSVSLRCFPHFLLLALVALRVRTEQADGSCCLSRPILCSKPLLHALKNASE
jgi:hypothetical protein